MKRRTFIQGAMAAIGAAVGIRPKVTEAAVASGLDLRPMLVDPLCYHSAGAPIYVGQAVCFGKDGLVPMRSGRHDRFIGVAMSRSAAKGDKVMLLTKGTLKL